MHLNSQPRKAAPRIIKKFHFIVFWFVAHATAVYGYNFNITLSSLTNHNTSAYSAYNSNNFIGNFNPPTSHIDTNRDTIPTVNQDRSLNPTTPGHVSNTDVHTLIPSRPDLRWFAHVVPWFGSGGHINIGINNNTTNWAQSAINDMINRGFNGAIIDWYGSNHFTDQVTQKMQSYLHSRTNNTFKLIIMVDKGVQGGTGTNNLLFQINYIQHQYFSDTNYERETNNLPILMFFGVRSAIGQQNMANLKTMAGGNMVWVEQGTSYINESWEDETFQWTDNFDQGTPPPSNNPFNTNTVISAYGTLASKGKLAFGGMAPRFNGTLTSNYLWSDGKYLPCSNGLCLVQRAAIINANIPHVMTRMQWPTWNDWEEGSQCETGIENNVAVNASVNGSGILSWSITAGEARTLDHYEIYASTNGSTAALIASVPTNVLQTNLNQAGLPAGTYSMYVYAVGIACVRDHLSAPASFAVGLSAPTGVAAFGTNAQVNVSWNAVTGATSYTVYWATNSGGPYPNSQNTSSTSASVTGLINGTPYYFVVTAENATNTSAPSAQVTATPLAAPTGMATVANSGRADLAWNPVTGATSYTVLYGTSSGGPYNFSQAVPLNSATITGLVNGTTYYFVVIADNANGASAYSSQVPGTPETLVTGNFARYMQITFGGYDRSTALTNIPVLVQLSGSIPGFSYSQFQSGGTDLRFTDANGNMLSWQFGQWNTNGTSTVWVNVPRLATSTDYIVAYWGNSTLNTVPPWTTNGSTWVNFSTVLHLEESGLPYADATGLHPVTTGTIPVVTSGLIGNGQTFTGASQQYLSPSGAIDLGNSFSLSAWVNLSTTSSSNIQTLWANKQAGGTMNGIGLFVNTYNTADGMLRLETGDGVNTATASTGAGVVPPGGWHYVFAAVNRSSGSATLYVDGNNATVSNSVVTDFANDAAFNLGTFIGGAWYLSGTLDETRIEPFRSSDWVWTTWMMVVSNSVLENYGNDLQGLSAPTGLTAVGTNAQVNLTWNSVSGATSYTVYWGTTSGGPYPNSQTSSTTSASIAGLANGTTYYFVVTANNSDYLSLPSGQVSATPTQPVITLIPTDYSRSMKITFSGYNRGTAISNFPVLVKLSTNLSGFAYNQFMSPVGNDLRFTDASGTTVINHEIDQWNTNGVSYVWVNVPAIAANTNYIYAYWGDRADTNTPAWTTNGSAWPNFLAVLHLKESGFPYADSTTIHPAISGVAPTLNTSSEIGNGETFDGATEYLAPSNAINLANAFSLSAWVNLSTTASNIQTVWANKAAGASANGVALFINTYNTADGKVLLESGDGSNGALASSTAGAVPTGGWHHVFASADRTAGTAILYVDGVNVTSSSALWTNLGNDSVFNLARYTSASWYLKGTMDEVRIEAGTRSSDWVWATWMNAASNSTFQSYGPVTLTKVLDQDAFTSGMKLTISGYTHSTTLTNFPLLLNFSSIISGFSYSQFASPNGYDLRFTDASGQILLNYQIDTWNTNGVSSVWVEVPAISSSTNYIMAYWGNPALTNAASFTTNGATWTNFSAVFHLNESGFPYGDATTLHPATTGAAPLVTSSGEIANAETFNGSSEYLVPSGAINLGNSFSLSAWVNLSTTASNIQTIWANKAAGATANGVALFVNTYNTADGKLLLETGDGTNGALASSVAGAVPSGGWHHVFASADRAGGTATLYVDGVNVTSSTAVWTNLGNDSVFNIGRYTSGNWYFKGTVDEARIEAGTRSADWVWATWMNVTSNSAFVSYPGVIAPLVVGPPQVRQPQLHMSATSNGLLFNWTAQGTHFTLYSATNIASPNWIPVSNYTVLPDGQIQVPTPSTEGPVFYRLQSQ